MRSNHRPRPKKPSVSLGKKSTMNSRTKARLNNLRARSHPSSRFFYPSSPFVTSGESANVAFEEEHFRRGLSRAASPSSSHSSSYPAAGSFARGRSPTGRGGAGCGRRNFARRRPSTARDEETDDQAGDQHATDCPGHHHEQRGRGFGGGGDRAGGGNLAFLGGLVVALHGFGVHYVWK